MQAEREGGRGGEKERKKDGVRKGKSQQGGKEEKNQERMEGRKEALSMLFLIFRYRWIDGNIDTHSD